MSSQAAVLLAFLLVGHFLGDFTPLASARMRDADRPQLAHALVLLGITILVLK